jgi:hypothetical protein
LPGRLPATSNAPLSREELQVWKDYLALLTLPASKRRAQQIWADARTNRDKRELVKQARRYLDLVRSAR